jgi:lactate permease
MTPILAGLFGVVTNSGGAGNGLFMASQIDLATTAGLTVSAVAALQHMSGLTMSMFSPVRMAIVCSLAGTPGMERDAYRVMLPFAVATIAILLAISLLIALKII